ncbi:glycosyl transferase group 1 [Pseudomonas chlororaphis]|uniref:Glycosyl transferase group 1 n=2 Tax=Pseudomonas TaxID=286 RepID=A0A0D5XW78_9PSED|nr:glycosyl transferase group 1 [Pseudomonas chlororaphis]
MMFFIDNPEQIQMMGLQSHRMAQQDFDAVVVNERLMSYFM